MPANHLNLCLAQIGQLMVFESGAVKVRIGPVLYELEAGISPGIREEVAAICQGKEQAIPFLGEVAQHAVITPDMDHLLRCVLISGYLEFRHQSGLGAGHPISG